MSAPALIRKQDMRRAAEVAKSTGCRMEIKIGNTIVTIIPDGRKVKDRGEGHEVSSAEA
jgi:hypothetical protein